MEQMVLINYWGKSKTSQQYPWMFTLGNYKVLQLHVTQGEKRGPKPQRKSQTESKVGLVLFNQNPVLPQNALLF